MSRIPDTHSRAEQGWELLHEAAIEWQMPLGSSSNKGTLHLDLRTALFELIDMRSFSNLWFWIALAVMWSSASHWVLGVPYDMIQRARRAKDEDAELIVAEMETLVHINVRRLMYIGRVSGLWLAGLVCFMLTVLGLLGFVYRVEFAQAVFLLLFPMTIVGLLSLNTARLIQEDQGPVTQIYKRLFRHRVIVQFIGMISIFVTAMWGMYTNLAVGALGG